MMQPLPTTNPYQMCHFSLRHSSDSLGDVQVRTGAYQTPVGSCLFVCRPTGCSIRRRTRIWRCTRIWLMLWTMWITFFSDFLIVQQHFETLWQDIFTEHWSRSYGVQSVAPRRFSSNHLCYRKRVEFNCDVFTVPVWSPPRFSASTSTCLYLIIDELGKLQITVDWSAQPIRIGFTT